MQQLNYPPTVARSKPPRQSLDPDRLWAVFLFGLLPALFVACLLLPPTFDPLRYGFIALSLAGLVAMWYRQLFSSATRVTISILYVALSVVAVSMLLNGNIDLLHANQENDGNMPAPTEPVAAAAYGAAEPTDLMPEGSPAPPQSSGPSEAEERLNLFMDLWFTGGKVSEMVAFVQPSWASTKENATAELFKVLANRTPLNFEVEEVSGTDMDNSRTVTMTAEIDKNNGKDPVRYRFMILMVKENGVWYVNPNSLATNETPENQDPTAPTQVPLATMAPRMTATPVPDSGILLYYNPSGGSFYHVDPECPRVDKKYTPLQGTFPFSDLGSYLNKFQPCLECRAPTKPLE